MIAVSTNWNSSRHQRGETLVDEVLDLGFDGLELGYALHPDLVAGIRRRQEAGEIGIRSVHAFSPVPLEAPAGHPELHLLADPDDDARQMAIVYLLRTLEFAVTMKAEAIVLHAGRVPVGRLAQRMANLCRDGLNDGWKVRWTRSRLVSGRRKGAVRVLAALRRSLGEVLPRFEQASVTLCLENLPSWDAVPDVDEMIALSEEFDTPFLRYWHDIGHGQIRELIGLGDHLETAQRLLPLTRGVHIHDVGADMLDHRAPGTGAIDFSRLAFYGRQDTILVFEPGREVQAGDLRQGLERIRRLWRLRTPSP